jgi:hypothetical protein
MIDANALVGSIFVNPRRGACCGADRPMTRQEHYDIEFLRACRCPVLRDQLHRTGVIVWRST